MKDDSNRVLCMSAQGWMQQSTGYGHYRYITSNASFEVQVIIVALFNSLPDDFLGCLSLKKISKKTIRR